MRGHNLLAQAMRQQARAAMSDLATPRVYQVSGYDGQGSIKVSLGPDGPDSGWMPLGCIGVGNGWGVMVGPQIGDQVLCEFVNGDINAGVVVARLHSAVAQPMPVPAGEIWMVHADGAALKFKAGGEVDLTSPASINLMAPNIGLGASGETLQALVTAALLAIFNAHTHPVSGSTAGPTTMPMTSAQLTTALKAG